jgi:uncharacterized protein (DUF697 family)
LNINLLTSIFYIMHNLRNEFVQSEFELNPEYVNEYSQEFEYNGEYQGEISSQEGTFNEVSQMELASELLSVTNEMELDQFLGKLFKKAVGAASTFVKSPAGKALGGVLKNVAKKALPIAGKVLGNAVLPGVGGMIGGALGNAASGMFELELEGLSQEDREFETAKAFVKFAGNAARNAASSPQNRPPADVARNAVATAARRYAPGLLRHRSGGSSGRDFYMIGERLRQLELAVRELTAQMSGGNQAMAGSQQEYYGY